MLAVDADHVQVFYRSGRKLHCRDISVSLSKMEIVEACGYPLKSPEFREASRHCLFPKRSRIVNSILAKMNAKLKFCTIADQAPEILLTRWQVRRSL